MRTPTEEEEEEEECYVEGRHLDEMMEIKDNA